MGRLLRRLGIVYKRGRDSIHSPDPDYAAKLAAVAAARAAAQADPQHQVLLYLDEMTVCRQPTIARGWEARGCARPRRSTRSDTRTRLLAALDAQSGQVQALRAETITIPTLVRFSQQVRDAYPAATTIPIVLDTWPNHFHPDLLAALVPQEQPFPLYRPASWAEQPSAAAVRQWGELALPIQMLPLPTDASWTNPIEKLWRTLRQELGHLHPWADDLPRLRAELDGWLATYQQPAPDLLRYVGLATHD